MAALSKQLNWLEQEAVVFERNHRVPVMWTKNLTADSLIALSVHELLQQDDAGVKEFVVEGGVHHIGLNEFLFLHKSKNNGQYAHYVHRAEFHFLRTARIQAHLNAIRKTVDNLEFGMGMIILISLKIIKVHVNAREVMTGCNHWVGIHKDNLYRFSDMIGESWIKTVKKR